MPTYNVTAADGQIYRVDAPAGATQAQIVARVKQHHTTATKPVTMGVGDYLDTALHGLTGSLYDNYQGGVSAAYNAVRNLGGGKQVNLSQAFDAGRERSANRDRAIAKSHPKTHALTKGVGMAGSMLFPEAKIAQGTAMAARMANGATTAGLYGLLEGAGKGRGFSERLSNAVTGGTAGAVFGSAMPVVSTVVGGAIRAATPFIAPMFGQKFVARTNLAAANRKVGETIQSAGSTPAAVSGQIAHANRQNVPMSPSDTSVPMRQLTGGTAKGIGPAQTLVQAALIRRQEHMAERMRGHANDTLGSTVNPHAQSEALSNKAHRDAAPLYDAAYQEPLVFTEGLQEFSKSPTGSSAIAAGKRSILDTPSNLRSTGSEKPVRAGAVWDRKKQKYKAGRVPVLEVFDKAKQHLDDIVHQNSSPFMVKAEGTTGDTRPQRLAGQELLRNLDAQVPAYPLARAAYAGPTRQRLAFEAGLDGKTRHTADDAQSQMSDMASSELAQFRLGDRTRLSGKLEGADNSLGPYADASHPIIGNTGKTELLSSIHGVPFNAHGVDQLAEKARLERDGFLTYKQAFGGSNTSRDMADMADSAAAPDPATLARVAALTFGGRPGLGGATLLRSLTPQYVRNAMNGSKSEVGRMLTTTDPSAVAADMAGVTKQVENDARHADVISNMLNKTAKFFGQQVVGNSGDQTGLYGPTATEEDLRPGSY